VVLSQQVYVLLGLRLTARPALQMSKGALFVAPSSVLVPEYGDDPSAGPKPKRLVCEPPNRPLSPLAVLTLHWRSLLADVTQPWSRKSGGDRAHSKRPSRVCPGLRRQCSPDPHRAADTN